MSKIAFCFPGQGSQRVGMGRELAAAYPEAAAVYEEASDELGFDVAKLCFEGPLDQLSQTELTQPALVATSLAALRAIQTRLGVQPDVVVGHSVGEYAAIAAADSVGGHRTIHGSNLDAPPMTGHAANVRVGFR